MYIICIYLEALIMGKLHQYITINLYIYSVSSDQISQVLLKYKYI